MTAPHPHVLKMMLEEKLQKLRATVVGIHSVVVERNTVNVGYDILTDEAEDGLVFFEFERPREVARDEVREFSIWLSQMDRCCETLH